MNGKLLNVAEMEASFFLRNCHKPNKNKNHKSNLHPQPPKGKHLKFLQLKKKKKEYKILPTEREKTITDVGKTQREDVFNARLRKSGEEHSQKQMDQN